MAQETMTVVQIEEIARRVAAEEMEGLRREMREQAGYGPGQDEQVWAVLRELVQSHARAEQRLAGVEAALEALARAQARMEEEFRQYREASEARFARIEAALDRLVEAQARTEATLRQLAEAQARTEKRVDELAEAQAHTEKRVDELAEAQARTEAALRQLAEAQARTEQMLQALIIAQQKLEVRVGRMDGELLEIRYERRATAYFGRVLRRVRVVEVPELLDTLEVRLTPEEVDEVLNLDLLVVGRPRRPGAMPEEREVWLAVEISATVDTEDVERAVERATMLRKAGYAVIPAAAGREATPIAEEAAQEQGVLLIRDGRMDFWDQALTRWRE